MADNLRKPSSSTSTIILLVLVIILFGVVVGYGWMRLLATEIDPTIAGVLSALITIIAVLLAQLVARAILARREGSGGLGRIIFLYAILFTISALGTINAAFYNFEGSSVLQQVIDNAEQKLAAMASAAEGALHDPRQEARAAEVERLLIQLDGEIKSPTGNCGVGPESRAIIARITALLPEFREFSRRPGSQPACDSAALDQLSRRYSDTALRMLNIDPEERIRLQRRTQITSAIAQANRELLSAERGLAQGGGFGAGYKPAQLALENAATTYSSARENLAGAAPQAVAPLSDSIDVSRARYLGSITSMPGTLVERYNYWTTWAYLVIAIFLDFFLVFLFAEGLAASNPTPVVLPPPSRDPAFLWVNEGA
jgi:hypothetical protein